MATHAGSRYLAFCSFCQCDYGLREWKNELGALSVQIAGGSGDNAGVSLHLRNEGLNVKSIVIRDPVYPRGHLSHFRYGNCASIGDSLS
ncbi:hypothetical protein SAMN05445850_4012 [Paraburkholderia tuberum]|uniref:Uncharacterized protein n=1 Tax=Paraburkholderia tuberum TaxID=157910 RepID=A0A1H1J1S9_9BURK|nr:hypothetical protein SAMN05445850_4012 [Paraburkholderia tuberum]